jgi:putative salt-induced outer membrane protein YdiY
MNSKSTALAALVSLIACIASTCRADTLTLDNGDRVTGTIVKLENGKLVFNTPYAGEIKIDLVHIQSLQADNPMTVVLGKDKRVYGKVTGDGTELTVQPTDQSPAVREPTTKVTDLLPGVVTGQEWRRNGHINVGWSQSSGNTDVTRAHTDAEIIAQHGQNRYTAGIAINYATDHNVETESNGLAYGKYDRFFSPKWYAYGNTTFEHDKFRDINLRTTLGVGSGYQAIASSRTNLSLEGGLEYVYTDYLVASNDGFPAMRLAWRFDHYLLPDRLQFFQKVEGYMSLENLKKSFARTQTGLRMPISGNFVATTEYDLAWDGDPQPGRVSTDKILLFTLGYKW